MGIVGLGRVGRALIERAVAFGLECSAYDVNWDKEFAGRLGVKRFEVVDDLLAQSDVISLNCPATERTRNLVNRSSIERMKDGVRIINCARGELVNTKDMVEALESGKVGGYATDVLEQEPPSNDHPLLTAPNTIITLSLIHI